MSKKILPKLKKAVKPKKVKKISKKPEKKLEFTDNAPVVGSDLPIAPDSVVASKLIVPQDFLPEGVFKKETVEINGRRYFKFYRKNGTTDLELLG